MGIFDWFTQKNAPSKEVQQVFQKMHEQMFPGGQAQINKCEKVAMSLSGGRVNSGDLIKAYVGTKSLFFQTQDAAHCADYFNRRTNRQLSGEQIKNIIFWLIVESLHPQVEPMTANDIDISIREQTLSAHGFGNLGYDSDIIPSGKGDFGLDLSNPVPVRGIRGSNQYLASLRTIMGHRIRWNRIGSFQSSNIELQIDCYHVFDSVTNEKFGEIYISPYHKRDSQKPPRGFQLVGD